MALPIITTKATGWWMGDEADETAIYVPIRDVVALKEAMAKLAGDAALRGAMGAAGRRRVEEHFDCRRVWALQEQEFRRLLSR